MQTVALEIVNSKKIFTTFSTPDIKINKLLIMLHGFRGSSLGPARQFVDFERILLKNNIAVFRFDQPNSGNSEGDFLQSSYKEWIKTTIYFVDKFLREGYDVSILGQSMGATAAVIASAHESLRDKIRSLLLWVPDPKSDVIVNAGTVYEEGGQAYYGSFWQEAKTGNFFDCLNQFNNPIHLVYGEDDRYIHKELREKVIEKIREKGQTYLQLSGEDHSPWCYKSAQIVFDKELTFLKKSF